MKKYILMGLVISLISQPIGAEFKAITDRDTGQEYIIYVPEVVRPAITLPEIQQMTIQELMFVKPIQLIYVLQKATPQEIQTISQDKLAVMITRPSSVEIQMLKPEKLAIIICQIEKKDLDEVLKKIAPQGYWAVDQKEFYNTWKKKDVKQMAKLIQQVEKKESGFILAYGNYQNYDKINWNRQESGFCCRQVLISEIKYDWKDKFKPQLDIILTIDFGLSSYEVKSLLEMIQANRNRIKLIIVPWAGYIAGGITANNYENRDIATYKTVAEYFDRLAYSIREVAPDIPIYLTVCFTSATMDAWIKSFRFPYDGIALWNILTTFGNLKKVYSLVSKYHKSVILSGIMECNPERDGWINFPLAKEKLLNDIQKVRDAGFSGVILMTNNKDR